ncbi:MAG: hypothetical protein ALAOOOJD_02593 [bacterium]|nr:hypothetical protein [bacterium]
MVKFIPSFMLALAIVTSSAPTLRAQVFLTQEQALRAAFSNGEDVSRQTLFLTAGQLADIQKLARSKVESKLVVYYRASRAGKLTGCAFFETTVVRNKSATLMIVVNPDSSLRWVQLLAFYEPHDYLPTPRWLALFQNKFLTDGLWPKRDIHHITGATLSVQALTLAVRRLLATYVVAVARELQK